MNETLEKKCFFSAKKLTEKIPDHRNAKEHYKSFKRKKNTKSVKQSEIIIYQPKAFENPNTVDIKSVVAEHPKTSHNFSKTEKVGSNSTLCSDIKKSKKFFKRKKFKNYKASTCF